MRYDKSKYMIIIYMWPVNPESYLLGSCAKLVHFHRVSNAQRTFTLHAQNIKRKGKMHNHLPLLAPTYSASAGFSKEVDGVLSVLLML